MSTKQGRSHSKLDILISGAGIAGLTAAHFLARAGHAVTVIERASALRASGQSIDVRGHALTVLRRMTTGALDAEAAVRAKATHEKGLRFVNAANQSWADFPVDGGASFTGEIEIMRGDLASVLYDSVKQISGVEFVFGQVIDGLDETDPAHVNVRLQGTWPGPGQSKMRQFDLVIAADGIASSTRKLAFPDEEASAIKALGQWSCWYSIPWQDTDSAWARWYNATRGRMILIRPDDRKVTRVSLWTMTRDQEIEKTLTGLLKCSAEEQKQFWGKLFADAGWEAPRVVQNMDRADDFYMQKIAQVKTNSWVNGRVVLVGDAGYCPSPVSGMGVTTAMTGAYVLAGEVVQNPDDLGAACKAYEDKMRPFVKIAQQLAPGTPGAANPDTAWGIWLLYCFLGFVAWTRLYKLLGSSVNPPSQAMALPEYQI